MAAIIVALTTVKLIALPAGKGSETAIVKQEPPGRGFFTRTSAHLNLQAEHWFHSLRKSIKANVRQGKIQMQRA